MATEHRIETCPECGNTGKLEIISLSENSIQDYDDFGEFVSSVTHTKWIVFKCPVCNKYLLHEYIKFSDNIFEDKIITNQIVYPNRIKQFLHAPEKIVEKYKALIKVIYIESETALIVMRKILEMICKDMGVEGKDLYNIIDYISQQNLMPDPLIKCLNIVRELGNRAAHDENTKVTVNELFNLKEIIETIIEYVYELPQVVDDCYKKYKITSSVNSITDKTDPYTKWIIDVEHFDYNKFKPYWLLKVPDEFLKNKIFSIDTVKTKIKKIIKNGCLNNKHLDTEIMKIYFKYLDN